MKVMTENTYVVYCYTSPSGKEYIGQSRNHKHRHSKHSRNAISPKKWNECPLFYRAIRKYGMENFKFELLEENLSLAKANEQEIFYIKHKNTLKPNGYNLASGGLNSIHHPDTLEKISKAHKGKIVSEETRRKISAINKGRLMSDNAREALNKANVGRKWTPEQREKFIKALTGRKNVLSETHKANIAAANRTDAARAAVAESNKRRKGIPLSEELKGKISEALKGREFSKETIAKMSLAQAGRKHTEESKAKMAIASTGRKQTPEAIARRVEAYKKAVAERKLMGVT